MKQNERIMGDYSQNELETLLLIEQMFSDLCKENIKQKAKSVMDKLDSDYPLSSIMNIVQIVYTLFVIRQLDFSEFINFLKEIEIIEENNKFNINNIFNIFSHFIIKEYTQESYYLIENMIEEKLLESKLIKNIQNSYFAHYMTEKQIKEKHFLRFMKKIIENYEELSKNDWELHKKLIKEGVNPNELAIIIRNDDIEKLQEISSQTKFDYNQTIEPSLYERCDFINKDNVTLIDYAAFFGSIKCFKYLLMNEANIEETGKYAVAGGNEEIIHLCEQNHSTFEDAYETAIDFHRNDIFKYLYENKIVENYNLEELGKKCVSHYNYKILSFLIKEGMKINVNIIDESARIGNIFLIKYFHKDNQLPLDILISSSISGNIELVKYILDQKDININANDYNGWTALMYASKYGYNEIAKLLIQQEGIDINAQNINGRNSLMFASQNGHTEITKLLLEQNINYINVKDCYPGNTALIYAAENGNTDIVRIILLQKGIDINIKNRLGFTALYYATKNDHNEIVNLLLGQK